MNSSYGLVLCGGGAKGAYQMGVIKALDEMGYLSNLYGISGVSIGALNGLILASRGVEIGMEIWDEINPEIVFDFDESLIDGTEGVFSRNKMRELLNRYVSFEKVKQLEYPLYAAITPVDMEGYFVNYVALNDKPKEDILTLMEATSALPVIYKDVNYGGVRYRDGGLCDNMPIKPLYDMGCRDFLVLSLSSYDMIDYTQFPDAHIWLLKPYKDLGGLLTGTLNFTKESIAMNLKLGYKDGIRYAKAFLQGDMMMKEHYDLYATMDYNEVTLEMKQNELQQDIDSKLNYIANLEEKYKIDW